MTQKKEKVFPFDVTKIPTSSCDNNKISLFKNSRNMGNNKKTHKKTGRIKQMDIYDSDR